MIFFQICKPIGVRSSSYISLFQILMMYLPSIIDVESTSLLFIPFLFILSLFFYQCILILHCSHTIQEEIDNSELNVKLT